MTEDRPYLQIPIPNQEDYRAYKEWLKQKQQEEPEEDEHVIILEL